MGMDMAMGMGMGMNMGMAKVRKPAPMFKCMAYWNGFKSVSLSDFKGKT